MARLELPTSQGSAPLGVLGPRGWRRGIEAMPIPDPDDVLSGYAPSLHRPGVNPCILPTGYDFRILSVHQQGINSLYWPASKIFPSVGLFLHLSK